MKKEALLVTNDELVTIHPKNGKYFELKELQNLVGGYIEIVRLNDEDILVINEEGKYDLPINIPATQAAYMQNAIMPNDYICGDVVFCKTEMVP